MAVVDVSSAIRLPARVNSEQYSNSFLPVRAIGGRIEQAHIELDMRTVIVGEISAGRRSIVERLGQFCPPYIPWPRTTLLSSRARPEAKRGHARNHRFCFAQPIGLLPKVRPVWLDDAFTYFS